MKNRLLYWFPRLIVIGFAVSLPFSAPEFITSLDNGEFVVWLLRLVWVLIFPGALVSVLFLTWMAGKLRGPAK